MLLKSDDRAFQESPPKCRWHEWVNQMPDFQPGSRSFWPCKTKYQLIQLFTYIRYSIYWVADVVTKWEQCRVAAVNYPVGMFICTYMLSRVGPLTLFNNFIYIIKHLILTQTVIFSLTSNTKLGLRRKWWIREQ